MKFAHIAIAFAIAVCLATPAKANGMPPQQGPYEVSEQPHWTPGDPLPAGQCCQLICPTVAPPCPPQRQTHHTVKPKAPAPKPAPVVDALPPKKVEQTIEVVTRVVPITIFEAERVLVKQQPCCTPAPAPPPAPCCANAPPPAPCGMNPCQQRSVSTGYPPAQRAAPGVLTAGWGAKNPTSVSCSGKPSGTPFQCGTNSPTGLCICP